MSASENSVSLLFGPDSGGDIVCSSTDHRLYYVHRADLGLGTGKFPFETIADDGIVHLSERAEILEILFQYIYPETVPALYDLTFETLLELAKAAEKYEVYLARSACVLEMIRWLDLQPREVFRFAAMYGYTSLMNAAERRYPSAIYEAFNGYSHQPATESPPANESKWPAGHL